MEKNVDIEARYIDGSYLKESQSWHSGDADWKVGQILPLFKNIDPAPATIGDIGCGSGDILAALATALPSVKRFEGWEIAPEAFAMTGRHSNQKLVFRNESLLENADVRYDVALAIDVFEHVTDYIGFLRQLNRHAKHFVFHIPLDASAYTIFFEENILRYKREKTGHLHYFSKYTALATLEDCGYQIEDYRFTHAKVFPPAKNFMGKFKQGIRKAVFAISPNFCARTIGGCSLAVLAMSKPG
jgi:2-polyprenyl-3-methyl-5-hydroxy-6-metoxy-1,4-benzoquinol methylase